MVKTPHDLIGRDVKIISLPLVFSQLQEAVNNPHSSVIDIGRIIEEDQGLTARMLRLANSPFYAFPSKIDTITKAVTIIGTQQMLDLVLGTSVMNMFKSIPEDLITMESFWHHTIACGIIARILAVYRREANVERFFVAGILHDIGRLIIYTKIPETAREMLARCRKNQELLYKVERETLGFDHADVSDALMKELKLPPSLRETAASHHKPLRAHQFPVESAVIHVANIIAHALQMGDSGSYFVPPLEAGAWKMLGFSPSILQSTLDQADRQFEAAVQFIRHDTKG